MSTTKTTKAATLSKSAAVLASAAAFALTGCSVDAGETATAPVTTATADAGTSTTAPEETEAPAPEPVTAPEVGATVATPEEIAAAEGAGLGVYTTSAGQEVVIDPDGPVAQVIIDDAKATGAGPTSPTDNKVQDAQARAVLAVGAEAQAAGEVLVFIIASGQYGKQGELVAKKYGVISSASEMKGRGSVVDSIGEAVAVAQSRIAAQADPSKYEIVNLAG